MATVEGYNLFIASWEHLYLLPNGVPAGLPNQLFSRHPWALVVFENLYCDENGYKAEQHAFEQLNWTNSELFVRLASPKYDIIKPLNLKTPLRPHVDDIKTEFEQSHGTTIMTATEEGSVSVDELFEWRIRLLTPYLDEHKLTLYDWSIARYGRTIPVSLQLAVKDVLGLPVAAIPLAKDVNVELSPERKRIFDSLQEFERAPLRDLRSGRLSQPQILEIWKQRLHDYREVDMELARGVDINLDRIMRLRERFGARGGWQLVRTYLREYDRGATARELNEIDATLRERLNYCFKPLWREFAPATWKITKGAVSLLPWIGEGKDMVEMVKPMKEVGGLMNETIQFFRGEHRRVDSPPKRGTRSTRLRRK